MTIGVNACSFGKVPCSSMRGVWAEFLEEGGLKYMEIDWVIHPVLSTQSCQGLEKIFGPLHCVTNMYIHLHVTFQLDTQVDNPLHKSEIYALKLFCWWAAWIQYPLKNNASRISIRKLWLVHFFVHFVTICSSALNSLSICSLELPDIRGGMWKHFVVTAPDCDWSKKITVADDGDFVTGVIFSTGSWWLLRVTGMRKPPENWMGVLHCVFM